jgi:hypothetical protein
LIGDSRISEEGPGRLFLCRDSVMKVNDEEVPLHEVDLSQ